MLGIPLLGHIFGNFAWIENTMEKKTQINFGGEERKGNSEKDEDKDVLKFNATVAHISRNMSKGNWTYLCKHPEIRAITRVILMEVIKTRPNNIYRLAASLFHYENIKRTAEKINKQLKWVNEQLKGGAWVPADGEMLFTDSSEEALSLSVADDKCPQGAFKSMCDVESEPKICPENFKPSC
ncbi:uncharacterized protein LOC115633926 [Scaptodrosophila lebanonensis]|uniref:Uncharacterized protein LOC115633926 n=1 Tax=Drosophila lebanonensis TaxID=7225 RepID=A0A6J2UJB6_DROLE|nr:uncharacterized protein LOC115633926 [Scaptodrosophila lebanonensis]